MVVDRSFLLINFRSIYSLIYARTFWDILYSIAIQYDNRGLLLLDVGPYPIIRNVVKRKKEKVNCGNVKKRDFFSFFRTLENHTAHDIATLKVSRYTF